MISPAALLAGVRSGDRAILAQAITLVESRAEKDHAAAQQLLHSVLPYTGGARRVGITGVPGVGKSTLIDELGMRLVAQGHRVAVLAVDPTSVLSGGSILGDKTRMARLAIESNAFIRPTPSGLTPGGVARRSRETLLLCEAARFDVVLVETVGVGQGEVAVAAMVDFFLLLMLPGAGDELQGIKKGVLELADAIAINKADGDNVGRANAALADLRAALRYVPRKRDSWQASVSTISAQSGAGLDALWSIVEAHHAALSASGELATLRAEQQAQWMWALVSERLDATFRQNPQVAALLPTLEAQVRAGTTTPTAAADELLRVFLS